jgi:hypothetical protein
VFDESSFVDLSRIGLFKNGHSDTSIKSSVWFESVPNSFVNKIKFKSIINNNTKYSKRSKMSGLQNKRFIDKQNEHKSKFNTQTLFQEFNHEIMKSNNTIQKQLFHHKFNVKSKYENNKHLLRSHPYLRFSKSINIKNSSIEKYKNEEDNKL